MKSLLFFGFLIASVYAQQRSISGSSRGNRFSTGRGRVDFNCPEDFGYYPHPTECSLYYVCVFGGALMESCTGGLMYSNTLQTCDWPRNVVCSRPHGPGVSTVQITDPRTSSRNQFFSATEAFDTASSLSKGLDNNIIGGQEPLTTSGSSKSVFDNKLRQGRFVFDSDPFRENSNSAFQAQETSSRSFNVIASSPSSKAVFPPSLPGSSSSNRFSSQTTVAPKQNNFINDLLDFNNTDYYYYYDDILYDDYYDQPAAATTTQKPIRSAIRHPTNRHPSLASHQSDSTSNGSPTSDTLSIPLTLTTTPKSKTTETPAEKKNSMFMNNTNNDNLEVDEKAVTNFKNRQMNKSSHEIRVPKTEDLEERIIVVKVAKITEQPLHVRNVLFESRFVENQERVNSKVSDNLTNIFNENIIPVTLKEAKLEQIFDNNFSNDRIVVNEHKQKSRSLDEDVIVSKSVSASSSVKIPFGQRGKGHPSKKRSRISFNRRIPSPVLIRKMSLTTPSSFITSEDTTKKRKVSQPMPRKINRISRPVKNIIITEIRKDIEFDNIFKNKIENTKEFEILERTPLPSKSDSSVIKPIFFKTEEVSELKEDRLINVPLLKTTVNKQIIEELPTKKPTLDRSTTILSEIETVPTTESIFQSDNIDTTTTTEQSRSSILRTTTTTPKPFKMSRNILTSRRPIIATSFKPVVGNRNKSNLKRPSFPSRSFNRSNSSSSLSRVRPSLSRMASRLALAKRRAPSSKSLVSSSSSKHQTVNHNQRRPAVSATVTVEQLRLRKLFSNIKPSTLANSSSNIPLTKFKPATFVSSSTKSLLNQKNKSSTSFSPTERTVNIDSKPSTTTESGIKKDTKNESERKTSHKSSKQTGSDRGSSRSTNTKSASTGSPQVGGRTPQRLIRPSKKSKPSTSKGLITEIWQFPPRRPTPIRPQPPVDVRAGKCDRNVCQIPDCNCGGAPVPGNIPPQNVPQMVLLTFDDSVNDLNKKLYIDLFEKGRVNPNGCPISATFYVSHEWTDYSQVQNLYSDGHEIASHSITHSFGEKFSTVKWAKEIGGQREIMSAYGGVRMEDIRGMRAPFLAIGGNNMFRMLYDLNFTYDSSMPVYENRPPSWPYTLDYKIFHDCMIPPCPTNSYPGVWQVPMVMWQDLTGGRCSMGDACTTPGDAEGVYQMLIKNFERHYTTNRSPLGLYFHAAWFTTKHHKEGFIAFLDTIAVMDDVWLVTSWQSLEWTRNPVPLSKSKSFKPFQCDYPERPPRCSNPRVCNVWHRGSVRYLKTCQRCPESYPWTGNTGVESPLNSL